MSISSPTLEQMELSQLGSNSTGVGMLYDENGSLNERRQTNETSSESIPSHEHGLPRTDTIRTQATRRERAGTLARRIHGWSWQAVSLAI